jgi:hypothetical protein
MTHLHPLSRSRTADLYLHSPIGLQGKVLNYIVKHRNNFTFTFTIHGFDFKISIKEKNKEQHGFGSLRASQHVHHYVVEGPVVNFHSFRDVMRMKTATVKVK